MKKYIQRLFSNIRRYKLIYLLSLCQICFIALLVLLFMLPSVNALFIQNCISITTGYTLTFIFYIIQIHIPKLHSEKKALIIIKPNLEYLYELLIEKISIFDKFVIINNENKIYFQTEAVYFKYLYKGSQHNNNINITDFLAKSKAEIDYAVEKIIALPVFNYANFDLIHSLSLLKLNNFWGSFIDFSKFDISFIFMLTFKNLVADYREFKNIIQKIEHYIKPIPRFDISIMTDSERNSHLSTLNDFKNNRVVLHSLSSPHENVVKIKKNE